MSVLKLFCVLYFPQMASTSSVESMPGADGGGALAGVSNLKLILPLEQGRGGQILFLL